MENVQEKQNFRGVKNDDLVVMVLLVYPQIWNKLTLKLWVHIHNILFSSNGPIKLECCMTIVCKGLPVANDVHDDYL